MMRIVRERTLAIPERWCLHAYYTLCPYAPDGSGRLLLAGADLAAQTGHVYILSDGGQVLDSFGAGPLESSFFHTGYWQTWSPDCRYVYYQSGVWSAPTITRRELATGSELTMPGDMEGAPPDGEPIISGLMGMLYAAGYGEGKYQPERAPIPFARRDRHGLFAYTFEPSSSRLCLSVGDVLERHPQRDLLLAEDQAVRARLGPVEGLTLMAYCVRWNATGSRFLFFFGNHNVVRERGEPRLAYVFTADRDFRDLHLAVDISHGRRGVHWAWHPDGEHLVGYGPDPDNEGRMCLAQVGYDGSGYRRLSRHDSGGHASISPRDHNLAVTDTGGQPGQVVFIAIDGDRVVETVRLSRVYGEAEPPGRNPFRICHHPVFSRDGKTVLVNSLPGRDAHLVELRLKEAGA
jgi:hypothetical protein